MIEEGEDEASHRLTRFVAEYDPERQFVLAIIRPDLWAALLDIELLDHIIVGHNCWVSLKERGLGFNYSPNGEYVM